MPELSINIHLLAQTMKNNKIYNDTDMTHIFIYNKNEVQYSD